MKKEELVALGLDENQIREIFKINGQDIENVRSQFTEQNEQAEVSRATLQARVEELEGIVSAAIKPEDHEALKITKESLESELTSIKEVHAKEIDEIKFGNLLDLKLLESKARSLKAVKAELDLSEVKYEDGKLIGIDEALGKIKEEHDYLFEPKGSESVPKYTRRTGDAGNPKLTEEQFANMTYTEKLNLFKKDPILYKQFTK